MWASQGTGEGRGQSRIHHQTELLESRKKRGGYPGSFLLSLDLSACPAFTEYHTVAGVNNRLSFSQFWRWVKDQGVSRVGSW